MNLKIRWINYDIGTEFHAGEAERLHSGKEIILNTGCEFSLFTKGFIPGKTLLNRVHNLMWAWLLLPLINKRLNQHLKKVVNNARSQFKRLITYGAGSCESIGWKKFDFVGVNLYRYKERTSRNNFIFSVSIRLPIFLIGLPAINIQI
jgi:hypothetical protein